MTSYYLPEIVTGEPLFVPSTHDSFSVEEASLPNGDPALVVHGDVNRDYKAHQLAQVLDPNVFLARNNTNAAVFSISFWIKAPHLTHATGVLHSQTIMSVQNLSFEPAADAAMEVGGEAALGTAYVNCVWNISSSNGGDSVGFYRMIQRPTSTVANPALIAQRVNVPILDNEWTFVVIDATGPGTAPAGYANLTPHAGVYLLEGGGTRRTDVINAANQHFSLGAYSNQTTPNGREGEYRIAKIAFHDHILSEPEREMLYYAMVG